jgi:hypothetical protein
MLIVLVPLATQASFSVWNTTAQLWNICIATVIPPAMSTPTVLLVVTKDIVTTYPMTDSTLMYYALWKSLKNILLMTKYNAPRSTKTIIRVR